MSFIYVHHTQYTQILCSQPNEENEKETEKEKKMVVDLLIAFFLPSLVVVCLTNGILVYVHAIYKRN